MIEWRDIQGFENCYKISNDGQIKSCCREISHATFGKLKIKERLLLPEIMKDGYLRISLSRNHKTFRYPIHILVAQTFIDNPNNYKVINHKDENRSNNNFDNLEWCSDQYNLEYSLSRHYVITDPNGKIYSVFNLSKFCKNNNLSLSMMSKIATGRIAKNKLSPSTTHRGWTCKYLTNRPIRGVLMHEC